MPLHSITNTTNNNKKTSRYSRELMDEQVSTKNSSSGSIKLKSDASVFPKHPSEYNFLAQGNSKRFKNHHGLTSISCLKDSEPTTRVKNSRDLLHGPSGPRVSQSRCCDIPIKQLEPTGSIKSDSEDEDDGVNEESLKNSLVSSPEAGYSFKTKVLRTESFLSNLSYPISLGLDYNSNNNKRHEYGGDSEYCDYEDSMDESSDFYRYANHCKQNEF